MSARPIQASFNICLGASHFSPPLLTLPGLVQYLFLLSLASVCFPQTSQSEPRTFHPFSAQDPAMHPTHSELKPRPYNALHGPCTICPHDLLISSAMMLLSTFFQPLLLLMPTRHHRASTLAAASTWNAFPTSYLPYLNAIFSERPSWTLDSKQQPFPDTPSLPCFISHQTLVF